MGENARICGIVMINAAAGIKAYFLCIINKATVKASVISSVIGYASPAMERNPHLRGSAYPMKAETRYMAVIATVIQSNILMRIDMCFFFAICSDFFA